jgi:hypothetical protein
LDAFIQRLLERVVERNADRYRLVDGRLERRKRGWQAPASEEE